MRIIFTRSNAYFSRLIRWVTAEPVSHCALEIDGFVLHSNLLGVHPQTLASFTAGVEIWGAVEVPTDYPKVFQLACTGWGKRYDFGALFYLAARAVCPWLPKKNLWQSTGMYLCTEWVSGALGDEDSMITPYQLFKKLEAAAKEAA